MTAIWVIIWLQRAISKVKLKYLFYLMASRDFFRKDLKFTVICKTNAFFLIFSSCVLQHCSNLLKTKIAIKYARKWSNVICDTYLIKSTKLYHISFAYNSAVKKIPTLLTDASSDALGHHINLFNFTHSTNRERGGSNNLPSQKNEQN